MQALTNLNIFEVISESVIFWLYILVPRKPDLLMQRGYLKKILRPSVKLIAEP